MKYYRFKTKWEVNPITGVKEGTDPLNLLRDNEINLLPHFMTGSVEDPDTITYAYLLNGEIDSTELTDWSVTETTEEAILAAAQELEPGATLEDGFIKFPEPEVAP